MQRLLILFVALLFLSLPACQKTPVVIDTELNTSHLDVRKVLNLPLRSFDYKQSVPKYLQGMGVVTPEVNNNKATLGRVLFYDKSLSRDGKVSCASCHHPDKGFADPNRFSIGVNGHTTSRNSPGLSTVVHVGAHYSGLNPNTAHFFWDMRAATIAEQSRQTLMNPHEMDMDFATLMKRVKEKPYYQVLFGSAYQDEPIDEEKVLDCIETFVSSISASKTRFDIGMESSAAALLLNSGFAIDTIDGIPIIDTIITFVYYDTVALPIFVNGPPVPQVSIVGFNTQEKHGAALFVANCSSCHSPIRPFQQVFSANIGLDVDYTDQGLGALTGKPTDMGVFKAPPLRNIALTGPYMHDGRFSNLSQVIDFYSTGIKPHAHLHPLLKQANGQPKKFNFTATEKSSLIAFLHTLTDNSLANDIRYNNPFK